MENKKYELIVLGGGAAAFAAVMKANELGVKALMINDDKIGIGGTCVNVGCLPTKHLLYAGELMHKANHHKFSAITSSAKLNFKKLIIEKNKLVSKLREEKYSKVLDSLKNIEFLKASARFLSKNQIEVNGRKIEGEKFIIATGSSTYIPQIEGIDKVDYLTNIEALELKTLPKSMIVLGGGALGVEFAQLFSRLGTKVCLLQSADRLVPREEPELAHLLQKYLEDEGIEICTNVEIKSARQKQKNKIITAMVNGKQKTYSAEALLIATGRSPNTKNFGLEEIGVKLGKRNEIIVDNYMQTSVTNIWAAGDIKGEPMLETVAAKEGSIAANNVITKEKKKMDYNIVPHAVFTDPQLAGVGKTDEEVIKGGIRCICGTIPFELVPKAQAIKDTRGAIKLVLNNDTKQILGVHILSPYAAELIHEGAMIVKNKMTIYDVIDTLHVFPTMSESLKIAAQSFVRDIKNMSCCVE